IYTLISHGTLKRGSPDWALNLPFTGAVAVEDYGDTEDWIAADLTAADKDRGQIRWPGDRDPALQAKQTISAAEFRARVKTALNKEGWDAPASAELSKLAEDGEITELLLAINKQIRNEILALLDRGLPGGAKLKPDTARRLRERD